MVNATPRRLYSRERDSVPIVQEAGWGPGPVWTRAEIRAPTGIRSPGRPSRLVGFSRVCISAGAEMFFREVGTKTELFQPLVFFIITLVAVLCFLSLLLGQRFNMRQRFGFSKRHCCMGGSEAALRVYPLPWRNRTAHQKKSAHLSRS